MEARLALIDTTASVQTPERIRFQHRLAGPGPRAAAWFVDSCLKLVVLVGLGVVVTLLAWLPGGDGVGQGVYLAVAFLLEWFYGAFFEAVMDGRTPGKLILSLRVVREDGGSPGLPAYILRNLLKGFDFLPFGFGIGVAIMTLDPKYRRLGDWVAGTVVVTEDSMRMLAPVVLSPPVSDEERQALPARVDLEPHEITLLEDYLRRRPKLSAERAEELAGLFGPTLRERTRVTAKTWDRTLILAYARATGKDR